MEASLPVLAGAISTVIFVTSTLPMLVKAARTKDLSSYSIGNILLSNIGNLVNTIYIVHLPLGPVWALHAFHLVTTGLMLFWYVRYTRHARRGSEFVSYRRAPHRWFPGAAWRWWVLRGDTESEGVLV